MIAHARAWKALLPSVAAAACAAAFVCAATPSTVRAATWHPGGPDSASRPRTPIPVFAYYYLWFNHNSWSRAKTDYPLVGTYSSSDAGVVRLQIQQAKSAGIDGFIVSWKHTPLYDRRLRLLVSLAAQEHFKLAMMYEGLNFHRNPLPVRQVADGFRFFADHYANSPAFFRLGGKPLTIWSGTWAYSVSQIAAVTSPVRARVRVLATEKNVAGFRRVEALTDGDAYYWSSVNPATTPDYRAKLTDMSRAIHRIGKYWIAPFAPGFDARLVGGHRVVPRNNGQTLRAEYAVALASAPDVLGLISWNEFSENSYVEPSIRYRYRYLHILRALAGTTVPAPTGPAEPSDPGASNLTARVAASGYWPNLIRLTGFPVLLILAVGSLCYARRRAARRKGLARHRFTSTDQQLLTS